MPWRWSFQRWCQRSLPPSFLRCWQAWWSLCCSTQSEDSSTDGEALQLDFSLRDTGFLTNVVRRLTSAQRLLVLGVKQNKTFFFFLLQRLGETYCKYERFRGINVNELLCILFVYQTFATVQHVYRLVAETVKTSEILIFLYWSCRKRKKYIYTIRNQRNLSVLVKQIWKV